MMRYISGWGSGDGVRNKMLSKKKKKGHFYSMWRVVGRKELIISRHLLSPAS